MTDLIYTHSTVRVPGEPGHFLINPYGFRWEEITASSLVKIDIDGNKVGPSPHRVNPAGWAFLTGTPAEIREVARRYGIYYKKAPLGDVDHTFLTSLVDQSGTLRVQYMGARFKPEEVLRDLQSLSGTARAR